MDPAQQTMRREVAALAAQLVADSGLDYNSAKTRAARQLCGGRPPRGVLPDNEELDSALREHLELFDADHPARVRRLRAAALALMRRLDAFNPLVTGAAWKGIAAEHAPIHLQLFHDNPKEIEYWLLDHGLDYDVGTMPHFRRPGEVEALTLVLDGQPVLLTLYDGDDLRGALRSAHGEPERGNAAALAARIAAA